MIKKLNVVNFKGHKDTTLEFHPGINVITGSSDAGKSTLLKGLLWVQTNRPTGSGMVSFWNRRKNKKGEYANPIDPINETKATIEVDSGEVVSRIKSSERNGYDIPGEELGAVGTDVPEEVLKILNMSDLNVAKQFDPPFLIGESAGEVARYLNKLIKIDEIDTVLSKAEARKRAERKNVESVKTELDNVELLLSQFKWLSEAEIILGKMDHIADTIQNLTSTKEELESISYKLEKFSTLDRKKDIVTKGEKLLGKIDTSASELSTLVDTSLELIEYSNKLEELDSIKSVPVPKIVKTIDRIEELEKELGQLLIIGNELSGISRKLKSNEVLLLNSKDIIKELEEQLPNICPLCGSPVKEHEHE